MSTFAAISDHAFRRLLLLAAATLALPLAACDDAASASKAETGRFYGAEVAVGGGTARAYVTLEAGVPSEIGVALSEQALNDLPAVGAMHDEHMNMSEWVLPLPADMARTPYRTIVLGWNPAGHEPPGIYDLPHFDFHFFTITDPERREIVPSHPLFAERAARVLAPEHIAAGYVGLQDLLKVPAAEANVPLMGLHYLDPQTPELNGQTFTTTFIYGSFDGKPIFGEPMITKAFIESKPNFSAPVAQPQQYGAPGYYPTSYSVRWDEQAHEYRIALSGLTQRAQ